jgi:hypothetical protein
MRAFLVSRLVGSAQILVAILCALLIAVGVALLAARPVAARISGGCTATATASRSGQIDLTAATDWNLVSKDVVRGQGSAPGGQPLSAVTLNLELFGLPWTILSNSKTGTAGRAGPYSVSDYSWFARVWGLSGSAGGGACTGSITITITNVNLLGTVAGAGGLAAGVVGLLVIVVTLFSKGVAGARVGGALAGLLSGTGFGLLLQQTATLDPTNPADLLIPALGLVAGALLPGVLARRPLRTV